MFYSSYDVHDFSNTIAVLKHNLTLVSLSLVTQCRDNKLQQYLALVTLTSQSVGKGVLKLLKYSTLQNIAILQVWVFFQMQSNLATSYKY